MKELGIRRKAFQDTGNAVHSSALQEVEQEKEVAFEVETICEVQKQEHSGGPISKLTYQQVSKLGDLDKSIS
jgi:hypothetical protein